MQPASPDALQAALMAARARARGMKAPRIADLRHRNDVNPGMMSNENGPAVWSQHAANYWPTDGDYS